MKRLLCFGVLPLISCVANPPDLTEKFTTVQAPPKIIAVPCISADKIPPVPKATIRDPAKADHGQLDSGVGADALVYQQYAVKLHGVLQGCATTTQPEGEKK